MKRILILTILLMSSLAWAGSTTVVVGQGGENPYQVKYGYIHTDGYGSYSKNSFELAIYNSSNNLIGTSSATEQGSSSAWVQVSFTNGPTLTSGQKYYIKIITEAVSTYVSVHASTDGWKTLYTSDTWPTANSTIDPGSDPGKNYGYMAVYITNSSDALLIGDNSMTGKTGVAPVGLSGNGYYMRDGYTCVSQ